MRFVGRLHQSATYLFAPPTTDSDSSHWGQGAVDRVVFSLNGLENSGLELLGRRQLIGGVHQLRGEFGLTLANQILIGGRGFLEGVFKSGGINLVQEPEDIKIGEIQQFLMGQFVHEWQTLEIDVLTVDVVMNVSEG